VLVDLVGSTKFMTERGNEIGAKRIEYFVRAAWASISGITLRNMAIPIKEIGDAVLLLFQTFPDVIAWQSRRTRPTLEQPRDQAVSNILLLLAHNSQAGGCSFESCLVERVREQLECIPADKCRTNDILIHCLPLQEDVLDVGVNHVLDNPGDLLVGATPEADLYLDRGSLTTGLELLRGLDHVRTTIRASHQGGRVPSVHGNRSLEFDYRDTQQSAPFRLALETAC
jgi:hypothetical protein